MNLSEKSKKYIGLAVPFTCCPIGEPVDDCPFKTYWEEKLNAQWAKVIDRFPEDELDRFQKFHNKCLREKLELARKYPDDEKYCRVNLKDFFKY